MASRADIIAAIAATLDSIDSSTQGAAGNYFAPKIANRLAALETTYPNHLTDPAQAASYATAAQQQLGAATVEIFEGNSWRAAFLGAIADGIRKNGSPEFNVLDYGAKGDGVTDDTAAIAAADVAALVVGGVVLFPPGKYTLVADIAISSGVVMMRGSSLNGSYTVTFNGSFDAGTWQVFGPSLTVLFGGSAFPVFNALWWGAFPDSVFDGIVATDCSGPIGRMFDTMTAITAPTECDFPASNGFYGCATPVFIGKSNITIRGHRNAKSPQEMGGSIRFTASGSTLDFFHIEGSYNRIVDLGVFGNNTTGAVVKLTNNFKTRLERCSVSNRQENLGIVSGPGYIFNGTGVYFAGDGSTFANGESGMRDCYVRGCNKGVVMDWGADGYMVDNIIIDCYTACIYSAASSGGWKIDGNKCYNSTASGVKLIYVAYLGGFAFGKVFHNEWEMTDADPVSGATACIGVYIKTGGQEGSVFSDNLIYTQYDNGHHFLVECINANDQLTLHHNYCGAKVGKVNTVAFDFTGSFKGLIDCDDNFTHDCTTSYTSATAFWKVRRSDISTQGWTFSKDNLVGAAKLVALSTSVTDATGNLFGIEQTVSATDNSAIFGYTFAAVRGLVNLILNTTSNYLARAGQFITTLSGAFATTGAIYGSYNQIVDSRSAGTSSEYNGVGSLGNVNGNGSVTLFRGFYSLLSLGAGSGNVSSRPHYEADSPIRAAGGTGTIADSYGFRSKPQKQSFVTNGWGFVQEGADDINSFEGNISIKTVGNGIQVKSGANGRINLGVVMVGGTVTVANTSVTANTLVLPTRVVSGGTIGDVTVTKNAGMGYTLTSANPLDTSTFDCLLVEAL